MPGPADLAAHCGQIIDDLNTREQWGLTPQQRAAYVEQLLSRVPARHLELQPEVVIRHFHRDHRLVTALQDECNPAHHEAWDWVRREIECVAHVKGLAWSKDRSVELNDLVQTVQAEVVRCIGDFHYGSSLRTWLQSVTVRRLRRYHRDTSATKRAIIAEPLEQALEQPVEWSDLEQQIMARVLADEVTRVLAATGDTRYASLFRLRVVDDLSSEAIGSHVKLHPSRVRALLKLARDLLRQDPGLRDWSDAGDEHTR